MKLLSFILFFLILSALTAQNENNEEFLLKKIKQTKSDSVKITLLLKLGSITSENETAKALLYITEAENISKKLNNNELKVKCLTELGWVNYKLGNYNISLSNYFDALKITENNNITHYHSLIYANIGDVFLGNKNYSKALKYYYKALKIDEKSKNKKGIAIIYGNIGIVYEQQKEYDIALGYYYNSLQITEELYKNYLSNNNKAELLDIKKEISIKYGNIGNLYLSKLENDSCSNSQKEVLYNKSLYYFQKGLNIDYELNRKYGIATKIGNIGIANFLINNFSEAEKYLKNAVALSDSIHSVELIAEWYKYLSLVYEKTNEHQKALQIFKKQIAYRDSMNNNLQIISSEQSELKYKIEKQIALEKKDAEKKDLIEEAEIHKKNIIILFIVILLILSILFTSLTVFQKRLIKKEKKYSDLLLHNILPNETVSELKKYGKSFPKKYDFVSVLFTDFKGFTKISEKMQPEELVDELNKIFSEFDKIISNHNLEKIKTIGDSYMCAGGIPTANLTNPIDTVLAGLEMKKIIVNYNNNWEIRIGIHTGALVAGVVGMKKFSYDIWGDTVNTASRMESSSEPNKLNISETTYKLIENDLVKYKLVATYRGEIEAKNKGKIKMYFIDFA